MPKKNQPMKKVRVSDLRPGMLVREDDPTAGYLIGVEAPSVARAINSHDALVEALDRLVLAIGVSRTRAFFDEVEQARKALAATK